MTRRRIVALSAIGMAAVLAGCTQRQTAISELLTIRGMTVGSTESGARASDCGTDRTRAGKPGGFDLMSLRTDDGACLFAGYVISDAAAKALADGTHQAALNVFALTPKEIVARYHLDLYRLKQQQDRGVAYCVPFAGPFDGLGVDGKPARIVAYRFAFTGEKLRSLTVELRGQCPATPFPDAP